MFVPRSSSEYIRGKRPVQIKALSTQYSFTRSKFKEHFMKKSINTQTALAHSIKIVSHAFTVKNGGIVTIRHRIPRFDHDFFLKK